MSRPALRSPYSILAAVVLVLAAHRAQFPGARPESGKRGSRHSRVADDRAESRRSSAHHPWSPCPAATVCHRCLLQRPGARSDKFCDLRRGAARCGVGRFNRAHHTVERRRNSDPDGHREPVSGDKCPRGGLRPAPADQLPKPNRADFHETRLFWLVAVTGKPAAKTVSDSLCWASIPTTITSFS